jgi:hypothetical protein
MPPLADASFFLRDPQWASASLPAVRAQCLTRQCLTRQCLTRQCLTRQCLTRQCLTRQCLTRQRSEHLPTQSRRLSETARRCRVHPNTPAPTRSSAGREAGAHAGDSSRRRSVSRAIAPAKRANSSNAEMVTPPSIATASGRTLSLANADFTGFCPLTRRCADSSKCRYSPTIHRSP